MSGRLARWGRRRPYIVLGTIVNVGALCWMAVANEIWSMTMAYFLLQFASNAIQAPFHALLPDVVPAEQRGTASGVMGLLSAMGLIAGALVAGFLVDAKLPSVIYQQRLWLIYGIIAAILVALMLITIITVHERAAPSSRQGSQNWWNRSFMVTTLLTLAIAALAWGCMWLWNTYRIAGIEINGNVQQVVIYLIASVGLLRIFDFHPLRYPDFTLVLVTRLFMVLGITILFTFLQYYLRDVLRVEQPEQLTSTFITVASVSGLLSVLLIGWMSDRFGRKRMIYLTGSLMIIVCLALMFTIDLWILLAIAAVFGFSYGAYQSVDWALVADVLPSKQTYARDMGVWNLSLSLPLVLAPLFGGPIIDYYRNLGDPRMGFQIIFIGTIIFMLLGTVSVWYIKGVKH